MPPEKDKQMLKELEICWKPFLMVFKSKSEKLFLIYWATQMIVIIIDSAISKTQVRALVNTDYIIMFWKFMFLQIYQSVRGSTTG